MDAEVLARFVEHDCVCPGPFESLRKRLSGARYIYPVELFSRFLAARGLLRGAISTTRNEAVDGDLEAFGEWLRRHRGTREATIVNYCRQVSGMRAELGADPGRYDAALVRDVLLRRFATASRSHARGLATSMRMYLRFLAARGECSPTLLGTVPTAPGWRLCALPRYVSGGAKVDHGSGGTVPLRRSKTLPVCEPFPVTGRVGRFIPWSCIARSVWRAGTG